MALLFQTHAASCHVARTTTMNFSSAIVAPPKCYSFSQSSTKTHNQNSLFSSTRNNPFSLSTLPRKLLCKPPRGKYISEDYLVKKLSAQEIKDLITGERTVPLIIDFYATWCGPCILMAQELEMVYIGVRATVIDEANYLAKSVALAVEYEDKALFVKVDTDDEYEFSRDMLVRGLPTLYFVSPDPSKDSIRTEGLIPIQMMRDIINEL